MIKQLKKSKVTDPLEQVKNKFIVYLSTKLFVLERRKAMAKKIDTLKDKLSEKARDLFVKVEGDFLKTADQQINSIKNTLNKLTNE